MSKYLLHREADPTGYVAVLQSCPLELSVQLALLQCKWSHGGHAHDMQLPNPDISLNPPFVQVTNNILKKIYTIYWSLQVTCVSELWLVTVTLPEVLSYWLSAFMTKLKANQNSQSENWWSWTVELQSILWLQSPSNRSFNHSMQRPTKNTYIHYIVGIDWKGK